MAGIVLSVILGVVFCIIGIVMFIVGCIENALPGAAVGILFILSMGAPIIYKGISEYKKQKARQEFFKSKATQELSHAYIEKNRNNNDINNIKINYTETPNEKTLAEKNLDIFSEVIKEHKLHTTLDYEIVKTLHSYIENVYYRFRLENNVRIDVKRVYTLFIDFTCNELAEMTTLEKIRNRHFGLAGVFYICCMLFTDKSYEELKNTPELWLGAKDLIVEDIEDLKEDFFKTMDHYYLYWHINQLEDENIENQLNGMQLFTITVDVFVNKHSLTLKQ